MTVQTRIDVDDQYVVRVLSLALVGHLSWLSTCSSLPRSKRCHSFPDSATVHECRHYEPCFFPWQTHPTPPLLSLSIWETERDCA
ncbi:unnamed protein product [Fusarium graminearum]|nr:unnamed protein product [Fusarium graminearum]